MARESEEQRHASGDRYIANDPPEMVFDIRFATGAEGAQLQLEQARVLREVIEWVAQRRSENGQDRAA